MHSLSESRGSKVTKRIFSNSRKRYLPERATKQRVQQLYKIKQAWAALYVQYGTSCFVCTTCENLSNACVGILQRATHRSRIERKQTEPGQL